MVDRFYIDLAGLLLKSDSTRTDTELHDQKLVEKWIQKSLIHARSRRDFQDGHLQSESQIKMRVKKNIED